MQFTGRSIQDWVLSLVGVAFTILLVSNMTGNFRKKDWGTDDRLYRGRIVCGVGDLVP